jgi:dolichyl-phosphate beta-glucosyltransferase
MISVIIPCYNEEKRLRQSIELLSSLLSKESHEILIINDGSTDTTSHVIAELEKSVGNVRSVHHGQNYGKGRAVKSGILASRGDHILFLDADASQSTDNIGLMIAAARNHDFIIGTRKYGNDPKPVVRRILSRIWKSIAKRVIRGIHDTQCGFKCFSREKALLLAKYQRTSRWAFDVEYIAIALENGWDIYQLPINWKHSGGSKFRPVRDSLMSSLSIMAILGRKLVGGYKIKHS